MTRILSRNNRFLIKIIDACLYILFFIPLFLRKRSSFVNAVPKKILILELWGVGDVVMMSSVLDPLRKGFPDAEISLLSQSHGRVLLENKGVVKNFFEFHFPWTQFQGKYELWNWDWKGLSSLISRLKEEKFDLVLDARGDVRNNILSFVVSNQRRFGYGFAGGGFLLTDVGSDDNRLKHRVEAWKGLLILLGLKIEEEFAPSLRTDQKAKEEAARFFSQYNIKEGDIVIGIHPGAAQKVRRWPLENFLQLAEKVSHEYAVKIIFFSDPQGYGDELWANGKYPGFKGPIKNLMAVMEKLNLFICNDTGVMHIATALGIPVVAIFGPGDIPRVGPYGPASRGNKIVFQKDVACRPCYDYCKFKRAFCILDIPVEDAEEAVIQKLKDIAKIV